MALLYLGHVDMQLDHSDALVLNFMRDFGDLEKKQALQICSRFSCVADVFKGTQEENKVELLTRCLQAVSKQLASS